MENLRGRGCKPKVTPVLARRVVREVKKNPRITTEANMVNLGPASGNTSKQTVQQTKTKEDITSPDKACKAHLAFANAHLVKEEDLCSSV